MKELRFNKEKDQLLKKNRKISFRDIIKNINEGVRVEIIDHPNKKQYPNQILYLIFRKNYVYAVPAVEEDTYIFLKTVYPSYKYTKKYLGKNYKLKK